MTEDTIETHGDTLTARFFGSDDKPPVVVAVDPDVPPEGRRKVGLNKNGTRQGMTESGQRALHEHRYRGGRKKTPLTEALLRQGDPNELAEIIISNARRNESWAVKLWANYIQSPELTWRLGIASGDGHFVKLLADMKAAREQAVVGDYKVLTDGSTDGAGGAGVGATESEHLDEQGGA